MQYNDKFTMKDLFMNKDLKNIFPQFTKSESQKNVFSFEWIDKKVEDWLKHAFNGRKSGDSIIINGKYKEKYREIDRMKGMIEEMFNNIPAITKNIRKNTKLVTPFQSIDQLKEITDPKKKMQVIQIIYDNLNYNPDFQAQNRFASEIKTMSYYQRQDLWLKSVGWYNKRRK